MTNERDLALDWFLADARAQGISIREYQRRYGIMLLPAEHDIEAHETALTDVMSETLPAPRAPESFGSGKKKPRAKRSEATFVSYPPMDRDEDDNLIAFPVRRDEPDESVA